MKKFLLCSMLFAFAMVACSKDELVSQKAPEAIGFSKAFIDNSTRSVSDPSYTNSNLFADFAVYGFVKDASSQNTAAIFDGDQVLKGTDANQNVIWGYTNTQYWIEGAKYNFSAVAPKTGATWSKSAASSTGLNISFTNDGTQDVMYAQSAADIVGLEESNPAVEFTFRHILSKVKFTFLNSYNANNTQIQVRDIRITNAFETGNATLAAASTTWEPTGTANLVLNFGNAATTAADADEPFAYNTSAESYKELLLIPADYGKVDSNKAKLNVLFSYDIVVSGEVIKSIEDVQAPVAINLEPGHAYDFKATITPGEPIVFTVANDGINGWDTSSGETSM